MFTRPYETHDDVCVVCAWLDNLNDDDEKYMVNVEKHFNNTTGELHDDI
jgi:hypothetical protein